MIAEQTSADRLTVTPLAPHDFEVRRIHNLLLFYESAATMQERLRSAESIARALRRYLSDFHSLEARS